MPATEASEDFFQGDDIVLLTTLEGSGSIAGATFVTACVREARPENVLTRPTVAITNSTTRAISITFSRPQSALLQVNEHEEAGRAENHLTYVQMSLDNLVTTFGPAKFGIKRNPVS